VLVLVFSRWQSVTSASFQWVLVEAAVEVSRLLSRCEAAVEVSRPLSRCEGCCGVLEAAVKV
jgi:hypothetical protein